MPGKAYHPGAACGDGRHFRAVHQQAHQQAGRHREQDLRGDARQAGLRYSDHVCVFAEKIKHYLDVTCYIRLL